MTVARAVVPKIFWRYLIVKLKTKKLDASVARRIAASLVAGSLVFCTGSFAFAADSSDHEVNVTSDNYEGGDIYAHLKTGDTSDNELTVTGVDVAGGRISGSDAFSNGDGNNNKVTVRDVTGINYLHGGYPQGIGNANYNILRIYNSIMNHIHGGHTISGVANYNKVYFTREQLQGATP